MQTPNASTDPDSSAAPIIPSGKTLAIDYGFRRIGIAVQAGTLSEPLEVIGNQAGPAAIDGVVTEKALARLAAICNWHKITQLLVGISEGEMAAMTQKFITIVQARIKLPVITWDETLSSVTVKAKLHEAGVAHHRPHGAIDHYAAATILEDWLDSR